MIFHRFVYVYQRVNHPAIKGYLISGNLVDHTTQPGENGRATHRKKDGKRMKTLKFLLKQSKIDQIVICVISIYVGETIYHQDIHGYRCQDVHGYRCVKIAIGSSIYWVVRAIFPRIFLLISQRFVHINPYNTIDVYTLPASNRIVPFHPQSYTMNHLYIYIHIYIYIYI